MLKLSDDLKKFFSGLRLVYFGTGEFAVHPLNTLIAAGIKPLAIVTTPDAKSGRQQLPAASPVKIAVLSLPSRGFIENPPTLLQPEKLDTPFLHEIKKIKPVVCILADYGKILPQVLLDIPRYGFLNLHPSLLPKYRGASPIESALAEGDADTGITLMLIDALLDHGPVIAQKKIKIRERETAVELQRRLSHMGAQLLLRSLPRYMGGKIKPQEQNHAEATFTRTLSREDGKISFVEDAETLDRKVRAFTPWPGTYAIWKMPGGEKRLKILKASPGVSLAAADQTGSDTSPENNEFAYGTVVKHDNGIGILTPNGVLIIHSLQLEGKKTMSAQEFLNGYPALVGSVLV